ncbi:protein pelota-like [Convolutriloba macropyga]|uniref:protein pelota-like n=1 Tax=Convolutriloba macropyga TaxID=536237 RepID=UPI003F5268F4
MKYRYGFPPRIGQPGEVKLSMEGIEDLWHMYNIIAPGDTIKCKTSRKVAQQSDTGSSKSQRITMTLTIAVISVTYDFEVAQLAIKGKNVEKNEHVRLGAHHTLDLRLNDFFTLGKDEWDSISVERIEEACNPDNTAELAAVTMQDGLAYVCLITPSMTLTKQKVEVNIPRKTPGMTSAKEKAIIRFHEQVLQAMMTHFNFAVLKCVIIASPGFVKDDFMKYVQAQIAADKCPLNEHKGKFVLVHSDSGYKHSLNELLNDESLANRLSDVKALKEVRALDNFKKQMVSNEERAIYGPKAVLRAAEAQAVEELLVTDTLFRSRNFTVRKQYVTLVEQVKDCGGEVRILSSLHESGQYLDRLTGVAALLRFPMPELDDLCESDQDENEDPLLGVAGGGGDYSDDDENGV